MHPEFWLVLAKLMRAPAKALLGSVPFVFPMLLIFGKGPDGPGMALLIALLFAGAALPLRLFDELPESWQDSKLGLLLQLGYLAGGAGFVAVTIAALSDAMKSDGLDLAEFGRRIVSHGSHLAAAFAVLLGLPLGADRLARLRPGWPVTGRLLLGLATTILMHGIWVMDDSVRAFGRPLRPGEHATVVVTLIVAGWPLSLGLGDRVVDAALAKLEERLGETPG